MRRYTTAKKDSKLSRWLPGSIPAAGPCLRIERQPMVEKKGCPFPKHPQEALTSCQAALVTAP